MSSPPDVCFILTNASSPRRPAAWEVRPSGGCSGTRGQNESPSLTALLLGYIMRYTWCSEQALGPGDRGLLPGTAVQMSFAVVLTQTPIKKSSPSTSRHAIVSLPSSPTKYLVHICRAVLCIPTRHTGRPSTHSDPVLVQGDPLCKGFTLLGSEHTVLT